MSGKYTTDEYKTIILYVLFWFLHGFAQLIVK